MGGGGGGGGSLVRVLFKPKKKINIHSELNILFFYMLDGVDFFYATRADARKFVEFLQSVVPCR